MISIILAAGSGVRMRPLSYYVPKVLLPVRGRPVLDYLLRNMSDLEIDTHYIVASEHLETIENYIKKTGIENIEVVRGLRWETGGDLSIALEQIGREEDAVVMNGDIVTDINMGEVYKKHAKSGGLATIAVFPLNDPQNAKRFGRIDMDQESWITGFNEKPPEETTGEVMVNTGFYIFGKEIIKKRSEYLVPKKFKLEIELFPRLSRERKLYGSVSNINYWWDVGTMDSYLKTEEFMINGGRIIPP